MLGNVGESVIETGGECWLRVGDDVDISVGKCVLMIMLVLFVTVLVLVGDCARVGW